jgi:hypothetical protein
VEILGRVDGSGGGVAQSWRDDKRIGDGLCGWISYPLQANRKTREGSSHPDRNAQFEYINALVQRFQHRGQPAVSVDTKKKELVGDFKNAGQQWRPRGLYMLFTGQCQVL